jgi:hypothetical protein
VTKLLLLADVFGAHIATPKAYAEQMEEKRARHLETWILLPSFKKTLNLLISEPSFFEIGTVLVPKIQNVMFTLRIHRDWLMRIDIGERT